MDWKLLGSTFGLIFLAELGDKTQLATFALASGAESRWAVFLGAAIAVLFGDAVSRFVPELWLRRGAGTLFIVLGAVFLVGAPD